MEEIEKLRRLIDASHVVYADALRNGMRMSPADLERLNRLSIALLDEANTPRAAAVNPDHEPPPRTLEHARAVLDTLIETGALDALGLAQSPPDTTQQPDQEVDGDV